jgi:hypothetical protein
LRWLVLRARRRTGRKQRENGYPAKNTRALRPMILNRHETPLVTAARTGKTAGSSAVGGRNILRNIECENDAAFGPWEITGAMAIALVTPKAGTDCRQAAGGARDWK